MKKILIENGDNLNQCNLSNIHLNVINVLYLNHVQIGL